MEPDNRLITEKPSPNVVICFDMDGTLLDESGKVHPEDAIILQTRRDVQFMVATGRHLFSIKKILRSNGLFMEDPFPLPGVFQNGASIYGANEISKGYFSFEQEIQNRVIDFMLGHPEVACLMIGERDSCQLNPKPEEHHLMDLRGSVPSDFDDSKRLLKFGKIMAFSSKSEILENLVVAARQMPVEVSRGLPTMLEVAPSGVNKGSSLRKLLERLGWGSARVFAAGDSDNDLPLFEASWMSIAPLDAHELVQKRASRVIDRNAHGVLTPLLDAAGL